MLSLSRFTDTALHEDPTSCALELPMRRAATEPILSSLSGRASLARHHEGGNRSHVRGNSSGVAESNTDRRGRHLPTGRRGQYCSIAASIEVEVLTTQGVSRSDATAARTTRIRRNSGVQVAVRRLTPLMKFDSNSSGSPDCRCVIRV
jgi:hypothetical protein